MAPRFLVAVASLLLVLAAAGCGGSDESASTASTTTEAPATTGTSTGPEHFTEDQWQQYQRDVAAFRKQNLSTIAKVKACAAPARSNKGDLQRCVGDSLDKLFQATTSLGRTLAGLTGTVSGDCAGSLDQLVGYVVPYQASIKALQNVVDSDNLTESYSAVANMETARTDGQAKAQAVAKDCAPV